MATLFREIPNIKLADTTTPASMKFLDYFSIKPAGGKCEIVLE